MTNSDNKNISSSEIEQGATIIVTHRVRDEQYEIYENWLKEISPVCRSFPGHLDLHIIRPISGLTATYTIIIRFDTISHLHQWLGSQDRKILIEKVRPVLARVDDFYVRSGLDFLFMPDGSKAKTPKRWKQFLVIWSAIYPVGILVPLFILPLMNKLGFFDNHYLRAFLISGIVVLVMLYAVMPVYTKLLQRWLSE